MGWANGFPLKGIRFLRTYSPYKKMPSWGGMRQAGCGEAKTVEGALRSAIKRFRFAADRLGTLFRVRKKGLMIIHHKSFKILVRLERFELPAYRFVVCLSASFQGVI